MSSDEAALRCVVDDEERTCAMGERVKGEDGRIAIHSNDASRMVLEIVMMIA